MHKDRLKERGGRERYRKICRKSEKERGEQERDRKIEKMREKIRESKEQRGQTHRADWIEGEKRG